MSRSEIQALVDATAAALGTAIVLEDADQRLLAHSEHGGVIDELRLDYIVGRSSKPFVQAWLDQWGRPKLEPIRTPANPDLGLLARWCIAVRYKARRLAYMWLLDDGSLDERDIRVAEEAATDLAAILYRQNQAVEAGGELLSRLLGSDNEGLLATEELRVSGKVAPTAQITMSVGGLSTDTYISHRAAADLAYAATQAASRDLPGRVLTCIDSNLLVTLLAVRSDDGLAETQSFIDTMMKIATPLVGSLVFGVGTVESLHDAKGSFEAARRALRIVRVLPELGPVAYWRDLGVYRALSLLPVGEAGRVAFDERVSALIADRTLCATAATFLDLAGNIQTTSAALHIHRATLYQRLDRIAETTRLDLRTSGEDRLVTHFGLKLARLFGTSTPSDAGYPAGEISDAPSSSSTVGKTERWQR